jgi:hypothetical protein
VRRYSALRFNGPAHATPVGLTGALYQFVRNLAYPEPMVQSRRAARYHVVKAGTIKFRGSTIDCLVRNLSTTGAALEVSSQTGIPERFMLVVPAEGLHLPCRTKWCNEYRIGVAFG